MYELIKLFTIFDWISPIKDTGKDLAHLGPLEMIEWNYNELTRNGWNAKDVEQLLNANGVEVVSASFANIGSTYYINIPLEQAKQAASILAKNGL